jgi:putative redox protein
MSRRDSSPRRRPGVSRVWHAVRMSERSVDLTKIGEGRYKATNARGGVLPVGSGDDPDFTPVELLLAAIAGCSAIDVDLITRKRADATTLNITAAGDKVRDEHGNHLVDLRVTFEVRFPEGEDGDRARAALPRSIAQSRDRLCTVGRTVQLGAPIEYVER